MYFIFNNSIKPSLTPEEILDFIISPYVEPAIPDVFDNYIKIPLPLPQYHDIEKVPFGLTKKEYNALLKTTKQEIEKVKMEIRELKDKIKFSGFLEIDMEHLIQREKNLKKRIATTEVKFDGLRVQNAKAVPIDSIVELHGGFARCPIHKERTSSFKYYPKENRWHCFGACGKGGDVIDLVMLIDNITFNEAVKKLCHE